MKIKVGVFFGGRSVEHEVSIITACQMMGAVNQEKYDVIPIYISKKGLMYTGNALLDIKNYQDLTDIFKKITQITLLNDGKEIKMLKYPLAKLKNNLIGTIDVALLAMHGTNGEDGAIQGYLEILGLPYAGSDILASSIGMDKIMMRRVLKQVGLPSLDYISFYAMEYLDDKAAIIKKITTKINYPVIVKAGNLGSSVGIKIANDDQELQTAINYAIKFTDRIMVERQIKNLKEINCSVIGDAINNEASVLEEPLGNDKILSYNDKYSSGTKSKMTKGMASLKRIIPAKLVKKDEEYIKDLAKQTFKILGCSGVARVDLMIDQDTNDIYVNEINTIPGAMSYYLWEKSGLKFSDEVDKLIELAFKRKRAKDNLIFTYNSNILKNIKAQINK